MERPGMALSALWYLGKENVDAEVVRRIREGLSEEAFERLRASRMPAWMASAIDQYGREPTGSGAKIVSKCCLTGAKTTRNHV